MNQQVAGTGKEVQAQLTDRWTDPVLVRGLVFLTLL